MTVDPSRDLRTLIASRHQVLVAADRDERRLLDTIRGITGPLGMPLWTWTVSRGLVAERRPGGGGPAGTTEPAQAVSFIAQSTLTGVYVFLDAATVLDDPVAVRRLKELAHEPVSGRTVILTGIGSTIPAALAPEAVLYRPRPPDASELTALLDRTIAGLSASGMAIRITAPARATLVEALRGLTLLEAERLIVEHTVADGMLADSDLPAIRAAKSQLLSADAPLDLVATDVVLDRVGGLNNLKAWLAERARAVEPAARAFGLPMPRGVLLTGVPGTGKSLIAKSIATSWGMALVAMDTGRLHGSFVGESEQRLSAALEAVEAMSPVVLWIDEIEKAFSSNRDSDGGASSRVLGVILRWLQERPDGVFVVATCNDVTALPPELTRRGRFDEIFFVDLPGPVEREAVLSAQLRNRGWDPGHFDLTPVIEVTEGFSGAELESVVVGGLYAAYAAGQTLSTEVLMAEARQTIPLAVLRSEDITAMRAWARGRAIPA